MSDTSTGSVTILECPPEVAGEVLDILAEAFGRTEDYGTVDVDTGLVLGIDYGGVCDSVFLDNDLLEALTSLGVTAVIWDRSLSDEYPPEKTWISAGEFESRTTDGGERPVLTLPELEAILARTSGRDDLEAALRTALDGSPLTARLDALARHLLEHPEERQTLPPRRRQA